MEAQAALVGAYGAVELNAVAGVDMNLTVVIGPRNAEDDLSLGCYKTLEKSALAVLLLICLNDGAEGFEHLFDCLVKFGLTRVFVNDHLIHFVQIGHGDSFFLLLSFKIITGRDKHTKSRRNIKQYYITLSNIFQYLYFRINCRINLIFSQFA